MRSAVKRALADKRALNESGAVAVYVALISSVVFGFVGLAIDASRAMVVHSEAQAAADAASLVGASQLDGTPTAISRATNAISALVTNNQRMASTGVSNVAIAQVRFLSALPASDDTAIANANVTVDPLQARFVEVTTGALSHQNTFLRAAGVGANANVATRSVAGGRQMVCSTTPLMICNPAEQTQVGAGFDISQWRGRQIRLVSQASGSMAPGNFGYLSSGANGANALAEALASTAGANICYGPFVETEPGQNNGARNALNTRFGIYQNPQFGGNARNNPLYAPDVNVRTMPRDNVFSGPGNRFGNGQWNCQTYWTANFGSNPLRPPSCTNNTSAISRHQMHEFEVANGLSQPPPQNIANQLAGRRIIYVAVINCVDEGVNGRVTVPSMTFLKVFITEPVTQPSNVEIYGEVVDIVQVGVDETVLREIVQIYR